MKIAIVMGAGGFIGHHMVSRLKQEGYWVRGVDLKHPSFEGSRADEFLIGDLTQRDTLTKLFSNLPSDVSEVYQFAADMGGAGYIFTGENDASVMYNSAQINLHLVEALVLLKNTQAQAPRVFYSSSACIYPQQLQESTNNRGLRETDAYPANPDSDYGWEKLFSERLFSAFSRNHGLDVRIARYHNIYGPMGTWQGGKEKAPAAICRKVLEAGPGGKVEVWGDGEQTRSFLYIDDCIEATWRFMRQEGFSGPINIGSEEMVSINKLVSLAEASAGYSVEVLHIDGPTGVRGRNSNNELVAQVLDWNYEVTLERGISKTLPWIRSEMEKN